jgi:nitrosocyanin
VSRLAGAIVVGCAALIAAGCGKTTSHRQLLAADIQTGAGWSPDAVTVSRDDNVILSVGNSTAKTHGFSVEGYGIKKEVNPGNPIDVKFKARKAGTFKIYCQLHPTHQIATLIVQ